MAESSDRLLNALPTDLSQSIRGFLSSIITTLQQGDGTVLHLEAHISHNHPSGRVNGKRWSKTFDISRLAGQTASPPLTPRAPPSNATDTTSSTDCDRSLESSSTSTFGEAQCDSDSIESARSTPVSSTAEKDLINSASKKRSPLQDLGFPPTTKRRRRHAGSLRPIESNVCERPPSSVRQFENSESNVPQRKKNKGAQPQMQPSTLDKLISGIWGNLYGKNSKARLDPTDVETILNGTGELEHIDPTSMPSHRYQIINQLCSRVTRTSSYFRGLELIIQAHWVDCFDTRVATLVEEQQDVSPQNHKKAALLEACRIFGWTEKELRNRMAIWRGYSDIKDVAGWSALIFSGAGIYRFCKYRIGFDTNSLAKLSRHHWRFEVAADTMHPTWRKMLNIIGLQSRRINHGHPLDWVVSKSDDPVPLSVTYRQWDKDFKFHFIEESVLDTAVWGDHDPRRVQDSGPFICQTCSLVQSDNPQENQCQCFAELFGLNRQSPPPVQVFATEDGRNNGLVACCDFPRGTPIGEFVGLITCNLTSVDVMTSQIVNPGALAHLQNHHHHHHHHQQQQQQQTISSTQPPPAPSPTTSYQILPHPHGNHLRFINHACPTTSHIAHCSSPSHHQQQSSQSSFVVPPTSFSASTSRPSTLSGPNSQYQKFTWLGLERIILVSKGGITAGTEILVDYGEKYWRGLGKRCLCGGVGAGAGGSSGSGGTR